uniref:RNA 3'-terminal phosphate cyclase n=1 Tax=Candidatus Methanophagaceae archaeon ANME-1 ERB6 TaxID=2759912 RepID=A0A7G9YVF8_9EURY|nr:RNA 3'-terminal phosphate cyclase [Methanosarcinales archaeon ANME-1 ERB6]
MVKIDGTYGEGGGQIIRTAIALAAITGEEVEIENIRANRPNPGLSAQHLHAVKAVEKLSGGRTEGLELRSTRLKFAPGALNGFEGEIDIGTAGSITLLLQCLIPVAVFADSETKVRIRGGTDVKWSPPMDFYTELFLKAIREMGCDMHLDLKRRGYYPKGDGLVEAKITPLHQLKGIVLVESGRTGEGVVKGISHSCGLPAHVVERQAKAAESVLNAAGYDSELKTEIDEKNGKRTTGCGITLWKGYKSGSALGERGKRAERVGEEAAGNIIKELESASTVDVYLADQLIPYIALANGKSEIRVSEMTKHLETNMYVTKKFLDVEFEIEKKSGFFAIRC